MNLDSGYVPSGSGHACQHADRHQAEHVCQRFRLPLLWTLALFAALIPSASLVWSNRDMPYLGAHDDGIYWTCSRALAEGKGYRIAHLPGEPYQTKFPPLYPAYLSLAPTLAIAAIANWLWLPAFAVLSYFALDELGLKQRSRLLISGVILVHPVCIWAATRLLSELMFASLLMATAIAARRAVCRPWFAVAAAAFGACACMTKTAGMPVLIALPAFLWLKTRSLRSALLSFSTMAPVVAFWHWWSAAHRDPRAAYQYYVDYFGWFTSEFGMSDLPRIIAVNLVHLARGLGSLAVLTWSSGQNIASITLALIACFGIARLTLRNGPGLLVVFACGYVPVLLAWNFVPGERFLLPLLPLVLAGLLEVFGRICRFGLPIAGLVTGLAFLSVGPSLSQGARISRSHLEPAAAWIATNTPEDARILTSYDVQLYLRTGRHAYRPALPVKFQYQPTNSRCRAIAGIPDLCRREHIQYLLQLPQDDWFRAEDPDERKGVDSVLRQSFRPVFRDRAVTVYQLVNDPLAAGVGRGNRAQ